MPSSLGHAVAGIAVASALRPADVSRRYWVAAAVCAVVPDLDAIGIVFGDRAYSDFFGGHRGFTHSLAFAVLLGAAVARGAFRAPRWGDNRSRLWLAFALATSTHGVLDAMTTQRPPVLRRPRKLTNSARGVRGPRIV